MTTLQISYCGHCADFSPAFKRMMVKLQQEYPDQLRMTRLECMAACDRGPVMMIEYDYYDRVTPDRLYELVTSRLAEQHQNSETKP
jgi:NADH-quinone oxidoreductase subunit E